MNDEARSQTLSRRLFLKASVCGALLWGLAGIPPYVFAQRDKKGFIGTKLSAHFLPLENQKIQCQLCPRP